jgi:hypothetical protein
VDDEPTLRVYVNHTPGTLIGYASNDTSANSAPRGDTTMATVPTPTDAVARSHVTVGASYSWDGSPLVVGMRVGVGCHSNRPPAVPE